MSIVASGTAIVKLDRAVWEVRRFCTLDPEPRQVVLTSGQPIPKVRLAGGEIEKIVDNRKHPARTALLWQNSFFGIRRRDTARPVDWDCGINAPLFLNPEILDEVLQYVYLPKGLPEAYRNHNKP